MNKRTIRGLLKLSYPLDLALLALVAVDFFLWDSRAMVLLLSLLALLLVGVLVLLVLDDRPKYLRLETGAEPEPPTTIIYGRHHG